MMLRNRREEGAILVEFALVLPLLLLIVFMTMQFGIILNAKINETHLTSTGARFAAVNQNPGAPGELVDYIKARADTAGLRSSAQVCVEYPVGETGTSGEPGDPVTVTMSYTYELVPFLADRLSLPTAFTVSGDATMRLEAFPDEIPPGCTT